MQTHNHKPLTKLIGLSKDDFDSYLQTKYLTAQPARLIPTLRTGDEMALTSIFLSTVKLVKEFRYALFKELQVSRSGKAYYYTEVGFPEIADSKGVKGAKMDGMIIIVSKGKITDAVAFEMKHKNNELRSEQIESYMDILKGLKVQKFVTVSNDFVADPTHSPLKLTKKPKLALYHFSWTYLITKGQLLLFKNDHNIEDEDQVEIMKEALHYFESPVSGVSGYTQMKEGWKTVAGIIRSQAAIKKSDAAVQDAVISWYEEEKDMALLLSRKLGVFVKCSSKNKDSIKNDTERLVKDHFINGALSVKDAVSDIKIEAEFERRIVSMSVKIIAPMDRGLIARINWLAKQLENAGKKSESTFGKIASDLWVEADVKFARDNIKVKINEFDQLAELAHGKEIQAFHVVLRNGFGSNFESRKKFIECIEKMLLDYYEGIVQHMSNWNKPAPKINKAPAPAE